MALVRVGLGEDDRPRGVAGVRDERLRAVEDVLVAAAHGGRLHAARRRSRRPARRGRTSRGSAPRASGGSQSAFCSSVPAISTGAAPRPFAQIEVPIPEQPQQSSSPTSIPSKAESAEAAERLGHVEVHQSDLVRLGDHVRGVRRVLVVLGRLRPDLLLGELARQRAQLPLLLGEGERDAPRHSLLDGRHGAIPPRSIDWSVNRHRRRRVKEASRILDRRRCLGYNSRAATRAARVSCSIAAVSPRFSRAPSRSALSAYRPLTRRGGTPTGDHLAPGEVELHAGEPPVGSIRMVVVHVTEGGFWGSVRWLQSERAHASSHFVVSRRRADRPARPPAPTSPGTRATGA